MSSSLLLVDDEVPDRFIIKRMLRRADLDVEITECADGVEALSYLEELARSGDAGPSLILLDLNMPRICGLQFLERFEELVAKHPHVRCPVLMMLTSATRADENACLAFESVKGILSKEPDDPSDFVAAVGHGLNSQERSQP